MRDCNLCLNYHDFSGTRAKNSVDSKYTVDFASFRKQLDLLSDLNNIALSSLVVEGRHTGFSYSLSFDDGYKSCLDVAEELAKRHLKGSFFIVKNYSVSNPNYLSPDDIREIDKMGMEIGSHSCTHRHMNRLKKEDMVRELHESKIFLEDILSRPVNSIAFPGGQCGAREINAALNEGYSINRTTITGLNYFPLHKGVVKCVTVTSKINSNTYSSILNLSPVFFTRIKMRELALSLPKYIESKIIASRY